LSGAETTGNGGPVEEGSAGNHKNEEGGQIHFALVEVRQCGIVRKSGENVRKTVLWKAKEHL
jgi:hypothetical protein